MEHPVRISQLFGQRLRDKAGHADSNSHSLLLRAGYIRQHAAGLYSYLTLGLKSLRKIERIVRDEMDRTGAQEILMTMVQSADAWKASGRYEAIDETLVRFADRRGHDMVLGMTHEEIVAQLAASEVRSYRDAGIVVYQIQTKFRDEARARGGLLRTREFLMKDAYSLHLDQAGLEETYQTLANAYHRIFRRVGLVDVHQVRSATGDMGGTLAHEFMALHDVGEDTVAFCRGCTTAVNVEVLEQAASCASCGGTLDHRRAVEVGNIFQLGTKYSEALNAFALDQHNVRRALVMGSYGIGVSRLMAVLVEQHHDEAGIALTAASAAVDAHVVQIGRTGSRAAQAATQVYASLRDRGLELLLDDRDADAGDKLADADLIGGTLRVTVGSRVERDGRAEIRERRTQTVHDVAVADVASAVERLHHDILKREGALD
jgi:prolyl-tRNA synthetase